MDFQLDHAKAILSRTPKTLNALLRNLPEALTLANEGPDSWSPFDVVGHLIHGEEVDWIPRAEIILAYNDTRAFEPFDRFAMFEKSSGKSLIDLLDRFELLREENLRKLGEMDLTAEMFGKLGKHPELGRVTLGQLLAAWVVHDLGHISQVVRVLAKQYDEEVGPWRAYLNILTR